MRKVAVFLFGALAWCCVGFAQFQFGSVTGLVKDPSQAPVPGVLVEIRSQTTNVARQVHYANIDSDMRVPAPKGRNTY